MAIPYHDNLQWGKHLEALTWHSELPADGSQVRRAANDLFAQTVKQPVVRSVQFVRDAARVVLKVPIRSLYTPIILPKNWKQRERATINVKLAGYSFVQLLSVPAKFLVALTALALSALSAKGAEYLLGKSQRWTTHLDGRAAQLEALKEEGRKHASTREEYEVYRTWLYGIDPQLCTKK